MLEDLTQPQRKLAEYMSELSEQAYCAGWMDGLESALRGAMTGEIKKYGNLVFTDEMIRKLKSLSSEANGWIIYDDENEETFVPMDKLRAGMTDR